MTTFRKMIYILIFIIVLLSAAMVYVSIDFKRAKQVHEKKVTELNHVILQLIARNDKQLGQIRLSDELREKLKAARETLDSDLLHMQYDFVETLAKNNLLGGL